jgi:hypothetical protein
MLDEDLATLYEVDVRALNQAVKRNMERFPADFAFRLTTDEARSLRSQTVILDAGQRGRHRKYPPMAFTEMLAADARLARKLEALEKRYDAQFRVVFDAIRELMTPTSTPGKRIGFRPDP